jgi:hypothetical protein
MESAAYDLDLISGQLKWDEGLQKLFGYPVGEPANTLDWWTDHIHPQDAMILNQAMDKLLDPASTGWIVRYRFRRADNTYVTVNDQAATVRDQSGQAIRLSGTLKPIATALPEQR